MTYNDYGTSQAKRNRRCPGVTWSGPKSVITYPCSNMTLPDKGHYEISGLAWSGNGAITRVEVSTDGGRRWQDAEFRGTPQRMGPYPVCYSLEMGRIGEYVDVALYG